MFLQPKPCSCDYGRWRRNGPRKLLILKILEKVILEDFRKVTSNFKTILANVKIARQGAADQGTQPGWERHTVAPATAGPEDRLSFVTFVKMPK